MFADELDRIERLEKSDDREERSLLPIDSCSQLDTGFTGRPDTDIVDQEWKFRNQRQYR